MKSWHMAVLFALVVALHASAPGTFHYDDEHAVEDNPHIRDWRNIPRFFVDPSMFSIDPERGMYRPVLLTTYAVDHALQGGGAEGFLRTNRLLHGANAVLVALLAWRWLGAAPAALAAGLLFGWHPGTSEPAHYVSARSDCLVTLFVLLTLLLWQRQGRGRLLSLVAAGLALWTKATAVALVPALLLLDAAVARRPPAELVRRHAPLWTLTGLWLLCSWSTRFLPSSLAKAPRDVGEQLMTQAKGLVYYLRLSVWPEGGSVEPAFTASTALEPAVILALLAAATVAGLAARSWRGGDRRAGLWLGLALVTLAPVLVAPLNVLVNERRAYLPLAVLCIAAVWLLMRVRLPLRRPALALPLLVICGLLTYERSAAWASEIDLWTAAVRRGPQMPRAQLYLGDAHRQASGGARRAEEHRARAAQAYERVLALNPRQDLLALQARNGLALIDIDAGRLTAAEARLEEIVQRAPDYVDGLVNLGNVHFQRARESRGADREALQRAAGLYQRALELAPTRFEARVNLGACYHMAGDLERAQAMYERAREQAPADGMVAQNLGLLYRQRAHLAQDGERIAWLQRALASLRAAATLSPDADVRPAIRVVQEELAVAGGTP
jgi:tetratricopeptide (TPR) repeat protein